MRGQQLAMLLRRSPRTECWATPEQRRLVFVVTCKPRRSVESADGPTQVREEVRPQQLRIRISQTHLGGVSSGADEPGCGSICVALRQSGPGLIV